MRDSAVTVRRTVLAGLLAWAVAPVGAAGTLTWRPLAPGLWWLPGATGDGSEADRGQVSHLLLASAGGRLWLLGSGPSPAFGRRLLQSLHTRWGRRPITVISPWPRPELVLGVAGLGEVQHVAHAEVAAQMAQRCAGCVQRLRGRLGAAAVDLGDSDPVRLPTRLLQGAQGSLGPWRWWRLQRADDVSVTVWQHRPSGFVAAPGLLWHGAPDGRDADIARLAAATTALAQLPGLRRPAGWIGEQGSVQAPAAASEAAAYWQALQTVVAAALERGDSGETAPATLPGIAPHVTAHPHHALNWQRAWRQSEAALLQRNLR